MTDGPIRLEQSGPMARLVLDAPPGNTMDGRFFEAFGSLARDTLPGMTIAGLVVTGGGRHFSSGADLAELRRDVERWRRPEARAAMLDASHSFLSLSRLPYPTVAAVQGACLGSGLELALSCTAIVGADNAVFALPESTYGFMPGCGGTIRLPARIGIRRALDRLLTGRLFTAAQTPGLVDLQVPRSDLNRAARDLLEKLIAGGEP